MTAPSETPVAPATTNTFVATASGNDDPPPLVKGLRWLMWSIVAIWPIKAVR
jgi:hypothetical protein